MNRDIAQKWLAALRSGKFKQGSMSLVQGEKGQKSHCCLGVLCAISPWKNTYDRMDPEDTGTYEVNCVLPKKVQEWAGLASAKGTVPGHVRSLTMLNDDGTPFTEIADVIEQNLDKL